MSEMSFDTRKRYCVNHAQNTVTISRSFQIAASRKGTPEYNIMMSIRKDFPTMRVTVKTYRKKQKPSAHLTYRKMETYLDCLPENTRYLEMFEQARKVSKTYPDPYMVVRKWFLEAFPDFNKPVRFDKNGEMLFRYVNTMLEGNRELPVVTGENLSGQENELDDVA